MNTGLYALSVNGTQVFAVEMDIPLWLPVKPQLNRRWLRSAVRTALHGYFSNRSR